MEEKELLNEVEQVEENSTSLTVPSQEDIIKKLDTIKSESELRELTQYFNFNLAKKDMARADMQSNLLDSILQEVGNRVTNRPGELTNKELQDYMSLMQSNIAKTQQSVQNISENPAILKIDNRTSNVNINIGTDTLFSSLDKDSRNNITDALKNIFAQLSASDTNQVIDIDTTKETK